MIFEVIALAIMVFWIGFICGAVCIVCIADKDGSIIIGSKVDIK